MDLLSTAIVWATLFGPQGKDGGDIPSPAGYRARVAFLRQGLTSDEVERILGWDKLLIRPFDHGGMLRPGWGVVWDLGLDNGPPGVRLTLDLGYHCKRAGEKSIDRLVGVAFKQGGRLIVDLPVGWEAEAAQLRRTAEARMKKPGLWTRPRWQGPYAPAAKPSGGFGVMVKPNRESGQGGFGGGRFSPQ